MRLNALHPEDNPMETLLYCFGGDGGGGGGGSDSSADDADSMDSGYDTDTVGSGTNTDMGGGGDNDNGSDSQDSQMDDLDSISAEFDAMDEAYSAGESFTSEGVETGGGNNDMGPGGGGVLSGDIEDEQMAELDRISQQFEDMSTAIDETGGAAIGGDESVSGRGTEGYEAVSDTYEGMTGDTSTTAGYPTDQLQASIVPDITITVPNTQDELMDQLDAIAEQFAAMEDVIDAGQNVAITGSGEVTTVEGYNNAKEQAINAAINAYSANPNIQNQVTLDPTNPENIASLEDKLSNMSLAQIDAFTKDMGGLTAEEQSYTVPYSFEVVDVVEDLQNLGAGQGMPISNLEEGNDYVTNDDGTISLTDSGKAKTEAFSQALAGQDNAYGITKEEAESIQREGSLYGTPTVYADFSKSTFSFEPGSQQGGEAGASGDRTTEIGQSEAGMSGTTYGGSGRIGDAPQKVAGAEVGSTSIYDTFSPPTEGAEGATEVAYDYPDYNATSGGTTQEASASGLGLASEQEGAVGLIPGQVGLVGSGDEGIIGTEGDNEFSFGQGTEEESEEEGATSDLSLGTEGPGGVGTDEGTGPGGGGDDGTTSGPGGDGDGTVADSGGDGGDVPAGPVIPIDTSPYSFGDPRTYDPSLPPFEYRTPLVSQPYDFMRDFGRYTLSEAIADDYAQKALTAPEGLVPYTPEYMEPISEMDLARQAELLPLIGERFPGEYGEFEYDLSIDPLASAQALIDALSDQSS